MENNNKIIDKLFDNKPLLLSLLGLLVIILLFLLYLFVRNDSNKFQLESITPEPGSTIDVRSAYLEFDFNQDMPIVQADTFEVTVEPEIEYVYGILDNKIRINFNDFLLVDDQTYNVTVSNILSRNDEVVRNVSSSFTVDLDQNTVDFLNSLPLIEDGFSVAKISDNTLFVRITGTPEDDYLENATSLLQSNGLFATRFNIDFSLQSEQPGFNEDGIRHAH